MKEIPNNWIWTTIGEVGIVVSGGTPSTKQLEYWKDGTIPWITPADLSKYNEKYISKGKRNITQEGLDYSSAKLLPKGTVLFSSRAPIGYTVIAKNELATNQGFKNLITTKSLSSDYVYYYFKTLKESAEKVASGTTFLELSATKFKKLPFPLAPLNEQKRIVLKIEEMFSYFDNLDTNLKVIENQLKKYKLSILKNVFTGNWNYKKWKEILNIKNGKHYKDVVNKNGKYPIYGSSGIINYADDYLCNENTIIIGRKGTINKPIFVKEKFWNIDTAFGLEANRDFLNPKFLYYFTLKFNFLELNQATTIPSLTKSSLEQIMMPVPPLNIQNKIIQEIQKHFSIINNLKSTVEIAIKEIDILKTKILDNAFKGKLVDNITNESAKDLLKQIQLEKSEYLKKEQKIQKKRVKKRKIMSNNLSIIEILEKAKKPILAKDLWQKSKYKNNIEKFYAELKSIENKIEIENKNRDSFIRIKNANK